MSWLIWLIENYPEGFDGEKWDMDILSCNESLPTELIEKYPDGINGHWYMPLLSLNPAINSNFVRKYINGINPNKPTDIIYKWSLIHLAININIDIDFVYEYRDGFCDQLWNVQSLCANPNITENFIEDNITEIIQNRVSLKNLSANPKINEFLVEKYENLEITVDGNVLVWQWDYISLARNPSITPEFLLSREFLNNNINIPRLFVQQLSTNINLTPNFLKNNLYPLGDNFCSWDMFELSRNPSIPLDFIMEYPRGFGVGDWVLSGLYENPNVDSSLFRELKYPEMWDIFVIFGYKLYNNNNFFCKYLSTISIFALRIYRSIWNYFCANYSNYKLPIGKFIDCELRDYHLPINKNILKRNIELLDLDKSNKITHENMLKNQDTKKLLHTFACSCEYILNNPQGYKYNDTFIPWSTKILCEKIWKISNVNIHRPNKK